MNSAIQLNNVICALYRKHLLSTSIYEGLIGELISLNLLHDGQNHHDRSIDWFSCYCRCYWEWNSSVSVRLFLLNHFLMQALFSAALLSFLLSPACWCLFKVLQLVWRRFISSSSTVPQKERVFTMSKSWLFLQELILLCCSNRIIQLNSDFQTVKGERFYFNLLFLWTDDRW